MGCCFSSEGGDESRKESAERSQITPDETVASEMVVNLDTTHAEVISNHGLERLIHGQSFTYTELYAATGGFSDDRFLGEGGFGHVYKGMLDDTSWVLDVYIYIHTCNSLVV
ncbi:hypothetical protein E2562_030082 [Oryza meyeriana var. granulata]|uniref:non-specific serine/threonine protein kinase n=1 Tax=Oryza meyeriana var. granulata TaxID=110450 RepID=A0A6G1CUW1_9ORYZ|nr:hypothetical protein E2562_030082 [Oryza meyeriana var. granulata]